MNKMCPNLLLLFANTAWGASFVAARVVLRTLDPLILAVTRFSIASVVFLPVLYRQYARGKGIMREDAPAFLLLGQLGVSLYFWLQYTGVSLTGAAVSSLIVVGLSPLITATLSPLMLREPVGKGLIPALLLGVAGVAFVVTQNGLTVAIRSGFLLGSLCLAADSAFFAIYSTQVRRLGAKYPPLTVTAGITLSGTAGLIPISLFAGDWGRVAALSAIQWAAVAYLALACSIAAYLAYNWALSQVEAARASAWLYLEPLVASVLGAVLLGETVSARTVLGGAMIMTSLYLIQKPRGVM